MAPPKADEKNAPKIPPHDEMVSRTNALNRQRGHLKDALRDAASTLETFKNVKVPTATMQGELKKDLMKLETQWQATKEKFELYAEQYLDDKAPPLKAVEGELEKKKDEYRQLRQRLQTSLAELEVALAKKEEEEGKSGKTDDGTGRQDKQETTHLPKIQSSLAPGPLPEEGPELTLLSFQNWRDKFQTYYTVSSLEKYPLDAQRNLFFEQLDSRMERKVKMATNETMEVLGTSGLMAALEKIVKSQNPVNVRRAAFFDCKMHDNERFSDFLARLDENGRAADISTMSAEDIMVYKGISSCKDAKLRELILTKDEKPTMKMINQITATYESANW